MKAIINISLVTFLLQVSTAFAQYPSNSQLLSDVKKSDPTAFVTVKPIGKWKMMHDKAPEWKDPDACEILVSISGSKKADGTWWSYEGFAVYNKVGSKMVFDRVFLVEDETRLNGVDLPDNAYFMKDFVDKMNARDQMIMRGNPGLLEATNFYSYELVADPRATGTAEKVIVFATFKVVYDSKSSNTKLKKQSRKVRMKYEKAGKDLKFLFGMRSQGSEFIEERDFGSSEILENIPTFENSGKTLEEMTSAEPSYPESFGSNGAAYPKDQDLVPIAEQTFLKKADNFKILFGEKGLRSITDVKFQVKEGVKATVIDANHMNKAFVCDYTFFNANDDEKKLTEYVGRREIEFNFEKDGEEWSITNAKFLNETEYIKKTSLNYSSYINTVRSKTYAKKFGYTEFKNR